MRYTVATSLEDVVDAYIERTVALLRYVEPLCPRAVVCTDRRKKRYVFKFTAVGEKYRHRVYVYMETLDNDTIKFTATPPYVMYIYAVMSPFRDVLCPSFAARKGNTIIALMTTHEKARVITSRVITEIKLLEPEDFMKVNAMFEGFLYETRAGYIATLDNLPFPRIDFIKYHLEDTYCSGCIHESCVVLTPREFFDEVLWK